jgi:hypothetical protein
MKISLIIFLKEIDKQNFQKENFHNYKDSIKERKK